MTLQNLIDEVAENWRFYFNETRYPAIRDLSDEQKKIFAVRLLLERQAIATGIFAQVVEQSEHGKPLDLEKLQTVICSSLRHLFVLAHFSDVKADTIKKALLPQKHLHKTPSAPVT